MYEEAMVVRNFESHDIQSGAKVRFKGPRSETQAQRAKLEWRHGCLGLRRNGVGVENGFYTNHSHDLAV